MNKKKKAVVTGGCGFIGSHIVDFLLNEGWRVSVVDNLSSGKIDNLKHCLSNVEITIADVRDEQALFKVFNEAEVVFHQAAFVSVPESEKNPSECFDVNIGGTIKVAKVAANVGVKKIVFASSCAVYGNSLDAPLTENSSLNPNSPYAYSKKAGEEILREISCKSGISVVVLRYFNIYGPRQNPKGEYAAVISKFIKDGLKKGRISIEGSGEQTRDFTFVIDVAKANLLAAVKDTGNFDIFNICSGVETSINRLAMECSHLMSGINIEYTSERKNDIMRSLGSYEKAKRALSYFPAINLSEGLKLTINSFEERDSDGEN